jgi:hypothetical protein
MARRPVKAVAQAFEIDDVADEVQELAVRLSQKVEQQADSTRPGTEMDVG